MIRTPKSITKEQALVKMETLCARSEQCTCDITVKLQRLRISSQDIRDILQSLIKRKFLDDHRFAIAFVNDKYKFAGWGKRKIKMALATKRITGDSATEALDSIQHDIYADKLRQILSSKAKTLKEGNTFEGRTKLFRFAAGRGFEPDLISSIIREGGIWDR